MDTKSIRMGLAVAVVGMALALAVGRHPAAMAQGQQMDPMMDRAMKNMQKVMMLKDMDSYVMSKQSTSVARGKQMFSDNGLGSNGMSCVACHPGGGTTGGEVPVPGMPMARLKIPTLKGAAATFPKFKAPNDAVVSLAQMDNNCINMFMMGKGLDVGGQQATDLAAYVTSLSAGDPMAPGKPTMTMVKPKM